jgi:hypothetical protein
LTKAGDSGRLKGRAALSSLHLVHGVLVFAVLSLLWACKTLGSLGIFAADAGGGRMTVAMFSAGSEKKPWRGIATPPELPITYILGIFKELPWIVRKLVFCWLLST